MRNLLSITFLFLCLLLMAVPPASQGETGPANAEADQHQRLGAGTSPDVAVDHEGNSHITWSSNGSIYYTKVDESGQILFLAQEVYSVMPAYMPKIAVDENGNAHIICGLSSEVSLIYIKMGWDDAGTDFNKQFHKAVAWKAASALGDVRYAWPSIAIDPNSHMPVVAALVNWQVTIPSPSPGPIIPDPFMFPIVTPGYSMIQYNEYIMAFRLDGEGSAKFPPIILSKAREYGSRPYRSEFPAVAVDSGGRIHCAWIFHNTEEDVGDGKTYVAYRNGGDDDQVDGNRILVSEVGDICALCGPVMVYDNIHEKLHIAWTDSGGDGRVRYRRLSPSGVLETAVKTVSENEAHVVGKPAIAVSEAFVRIAWPDRRDDQTEIYFSAVGASSGEVKADVRLTDHPADCRNPAVAVNEWGVASIVWQDHRSGDPEILKFRAPWTWILYLDGDTMYKSGPGHEVYFSKVIVPLERGAWNPCVNVIVQFDGMESQDSRRLRIHPVNREPAGGAAPTMDDIYKPYNHTGIDTWYVGPNGIQDAPGEVDMADPTVLNSYIRWANENFVQGNDGMARRRAMMSIIEHRDWWRTDFEERVQGTGWGPTPIYMDENGTPDDQTDDAFMGFPALRSALHNDGEPFYFDILYFDACLMGLVETAYEFNEFSRYMLFSQTYSIEAPYDQYLSKINAATPAWAPESDPQPPGLVTIIADSYRDHARQNTTSRYTISAVNCSRISELCTKIDALVAGPSGLMSSPDLKTTYIEAWKNSLHVDDDGRYTDLYDFCEKLKTELLEIEGTDVIIEKAQSIMDEISATEDERLVVAEHHDNGLSKDSHGLSIYFPFSRPDIGIVGVSEEQEEEPGSFMVVSADLQDHQLIPAYIRFPTIENEGILTLSRDNDKLNVWAVDDEGNKTPILVDQNVISWDLSNIIDRETLEKINSNLRVEPKALGNTTLRLLYTGTTQIAEESEDVAQNTNIALNVTVNSDNDKDRIIDGRDDEKETTEPFIFWLNDDDDDGIAGQNDSEDFWIDGLKDLEDLAPIRLQTSWIDPIPAGFKYRLELNGGAQIRVFRYEGTQTEYLTKKEVATVLPWQEEYASGLVGDGRYVDIDPGDFKGSEGSENKEMWLLFEGVKPGEGSLCLSLVNEEGIRQTESIKCLLKIQKIEQFYAAVTARDPEDKKVNSIVIGVGGDFLTIYDLKKDKDYVVFLHGYNVAIDKAFETFSTVFKRLYWNGVIGEGGDSEFVGITWFGNETWFSFFNKNVFNAFQTSIPVGKFLKDLNDRNSGRQLNVMAHSLGNLVVSNAIKNTDDLHVNKYISIQSAVAANAYNANYDGDGVNPEDGVKPDLELLAQASMWGYPDDVPHKSICLIYFLSDMSCWNGKWTQTQWTQERYIDKKDNDTDYWDEYYHYRDIPSTIFDPWGDYFHVLIDEDKVAEMINTFYWGDKVVGEVWRQNQLLIIPDLQGGSWKRLPDSLPLGKIEGIEDEEVKKDAEQNREWAELSYYFNSVSPAAGSIKIPGITNIIYQDFISTLQPGLKSHGAFVDLPMIEVWKFWQKMAKELKEVPGQ
jgi:cysteine peptidase C11 family protein/alpha/beta hydrolase family protein DUF900